jgi:hypothetical protein
MRYQDLTREQVIEALTDEAISYFWGDDRDFDFAENDHAVLRAYLREGFVGFETRSDEELAEEWRRVFGADDDEGEPR